MKSSRVDRPPGATSMGSCHPFWECLANDRQNQSATAFRSAQFGNGICGSTTTDIQIRVVDIMGLYSGFDVPSTSLIISTRMIRMGGFTQLPLATVSIVLLTLSTGPLLAGAVPLAVPLSHRLLSYWFWNMLDVFSESSTWGIPWYTIYITSGLKQLLPVAIGHLDHLHLRYDPVSRMQFVELLRRICFAFGMVWEKPGMEPWNHPMQPIGILWLSIQP